MATSSQPQDPSGRTGGPGDVPAGRPGSLDRLDVLTDDWEMEATFEAGYFGPGSPATTERGGRTTFEWLQGRYFLTQRFVVDHPAAPSGISIIGARRPGDLRPALLRLARRRSRLPDVPGRRGLEALA
jgi:hypothetical protein